MIPLVNGEMIKVSTTRTALGFGVASVLLVLAVVLITILAGDPDTVQEKKDALNLGGALCIPLLLVTFSVGNGARIYKPDFFDVPTDFWLNLYWLLLCGTLIYLLGYGIRALLVLRKDPVDADHFSTPTVLPIGGALACGFLATPWAGRPWSTMAAPWAPPATPSTSTRA